jgi:RNA polymerase-binding transcription factor DksA
MGWDRHSYQVKEKFGGLRFYIGGAEKEIHDRITKAEAESYHVCEVCGEPGKLRQTGWVLTLCAPCYKEHKKAK